MKKIATTLAILAATVALAAPAHAEVYPPQWKCGINTAGNSANCLPTVWVKARNEINARTVAKAKWTAAFTSTMGYAPGICSAGLGRYNAKRKEYKVLLICPVPVR